MKWTLDEFLKVTSGVLLQKKEVHFDNVSYDTRISKDLPHSCFFALQSQKDGHLYLEDAFKKGASILVVSNPDIPSTLKNKITIIHVPDTMKTLSKWALYWREKLNLKVVAITGSNGKTSTKHFVKILLGEEPYVQVSASSFNNELGLALSFLRMDLKTRIAIQEIGINRVNEMDERLKLVQPSISVCIGVSESHIAGLKNKQTIAKEKEKIYQHPCVELGLFNLDDEWVKQMKHQFQKRSLCFSSIDSNADVYLSVSEVHFQSIDVFGHIQGREASSHIKLSGVHHISSVAAAVCVALALDVPTEKIWKRLSLLTPMKGRCEHLSIQDKIKIFYDAYNANPLSMKAFLEHLKLFHNENKFILCLGDMLELGSYSSTAHQDLGHQVGLLNFQTLFYLGKEGESFKKGLQSAGYKGSCMISESYNKDFVSKIFSVIKHSDSILALKASRGLKLERLIKDLDLLL